ncbi:hypothetical protein HDV00_009759 [Rhizophlyctis rosea]|nr:hypothetical protein HDV00_009759 [Rhizophlyctis rosea]
MLLQQAIMDLAGLQSRLTENALELERRDYVCGIVHGVPIFMPKPARGSWQPTTGATALTHFNSLRHCDIIIRVPLRSRVHPVPIEDMEVAYLSRSPTIHNTILPQVSNASSHPQAYLPTITINPPAPKQFADSLYHLYTGSIDPSTLEPDRLIGTLLNALYLNLPSVLQACRPRLHEALPHVATKADFGPRSVPPQLLTELMKASRTAGGPLTARDRLEILLAWGKDVGDSDSLRGLVGQLMYGEELDVAEMASLAERWGPVFERAVPPTIILKAGLSRAPVGNAGGAYPHSQRYPMPQQAMGPPQLPFVPLLRRSTAQMSFVWED